MLKRIIKEIKEWQPNPSDYYKMWLALAVLQLITDIVLNINC